MQNVPHWLLRHLSESDLAAFEAAVTKAETKTAGEIMPMVVRRSTSEGFVPEVLACVGAFLTLLIATYLLTSPEHLHGWMNSFGFWMGASAVGGAIGFAFGKCEAVQRRLIPLEDQLRQIHLRAETAFFEANLSKTEAQTGVLIFVSLMERRVVIFADKNIDTKVAKEEWQAIVKEMIAKKRAGGLRAAFEHGIARCGDTLATHFPISDYDRNEIHNHLVIYE